MITGAALSSKSTAIILIDEGDELEKNNEGDEGGGAAAEQETPYPLKKAGGGINIGFFRGRARRIKRRMQVHHHEHEE